MAKQIISFLAFFFFTANAFAQKPDATEMRRQIEEMKNDPQKLMKYRDSIMNAFAKQQSVKMPNGDQLMQKHHYDTGYAKVQFNYNYESYTKAGIYESHKSITFSGKSTKAPMIYEANGHTIVQAMTGQPAIGNGVGMLNEGANGINSSVPNMARQEAQAHTDLARQMSFSAMVAANNTLKASTTYVSNTTGGDNGSNTLASGTTMAGISFDYDPVQNLSSVGLAGEVTITTTYENGRPAKTDSVGIGMSASTEMSKAKLSGVPSMPIDPKTTNIVVLKTVSGYKITYNRTVNKSNDGAINNLHETLTVIIGEDVQQYEAFIMPFANSNYENWLPKGPVTDNTNNVKGDDSLKFFITIRDSKDNSKQYPGTFSVHWKLRDITHYPGFCSNYPVFDDAKGDPDITFFDSMKLDPMHYITDEVNDSDAQGRDGMGTTSFAHIHCMDYGGWAKLYAEITLEDSTKLLAEPYYDKTLNYITIPFDKDENKVADAWEKRMKIDGKHYALTWDEETDLPNNGHNGDNIYLLDEYRGFVIDSNGKAGYRRLDPLRKELFVLATLFSEDQHPDLIKAGAKLYSNATGVKTLTIGLTAETILYKHANGMHNSRFASCVNFNTPFHHYTYGVPVYFNPAAYQAEACTGRVPGIPEGVGAQTPEDDDYISLFWANMKKTILPKAKWFLPYSTDPDAAPRKHLRHAIEEFHYTIDTNIMGTSIEQNIDTLISRYAEWNIMHELGHATNMPHHHLNDPTEPDPTDGKQISVGYYRGVSTCPMRYWFMTVLVNKTRPECAINSDRIEALISGAWNPISGLWPDKSPMKFCTTEDNCLSKLSLKK